MLRTTVLAAVCGLLAASAAAGQEKKPRSPKADGDRTAKMLAALHGTRLPRGLNVNDAPLMDILMVLTKEGDVPFVVREDLFKDEGLANAKEFKPRLTAVRPDGMTAHRFLTLVLKEMNATYLVREGFIEIVPRPFALKEAGIEEAVQEAGSNADDPVAAVRAHYRMNLPLVSVVAEERPLDEVLAELARHYDLNVVIAPDARKQIKQVMVSERLLNVPADTMLETLAGLAGLDVTRKGNTFRVGFGR